MLSIPDIMIFLRLHLARFCAKGAAAVQALIDAGAYIVTRESNGLEMLTEFKRKIGGSVTGTRSIGAERDRILLTFL